MELEIRTLLEYVEEGDRVLDVGCASGWSTVRWAFERRVFVRGLDYVPEMIEHARTYASKLADKLAGKVEFAVGDITALPEPDDSWDKLIVKRVVINLGNWEAQAKALGECARVLVPGGRLLLSEATLQGWEKLNAFRAEWGLDPIAMPPFNNYLDQDAVIEAARPALELVELRNFSSTYYVGTRVLKPLLARLAGDAVDASAPDMHWNRWVAQLPPVGDYGTQKLFVFEKPVD